MRPRVRHTRLCKILEIFPPTSRARCESKSSNSRSYIKLEMWRRDPYPFEIQWRSELVGKVTWKWPNGHSLSFSRNCTVTSLVLSMFPHHQNHPKKLLIVNLNTIYNDMDQVRGLPSTETTRICWRSSFTVTTRCSAGRGLSRGFSPISSFKD